MKINRQILLKDRKIFTNTYCGCEFFIIQKHFLKLIKQSKSCNKYYKIYTKSLISKCWNLNPCDYVNKVEGYLIKSFWPHCLKKKKINIYLYET